MGDLLAAAKRNPTVVFVLIGLVVLFVYLKSRSSSSSSGGAGIAADSGGGVTFTGGGEIAPQIDPGLASVMAAQVGARSADFQTAAATILGSQQSTDAVTLGTEQLGVQQTLGLAQTDAQIKTAQINGDTQTKVAQLNNNAQMFQIQAQKDIARANDNTQIATKAFDFIGNVAKKVWSWL